MTIPQSLPTPRYAGWSYNKIKHIGTIRYGVGEPPEEKDDGVLFVRATDIHAGKIYGERMLRVDPQKVPWHRDVSLAANDIIVVRSGAYTGDSAIIPAEYQGAVVGFDLVLRCHSANPSFVQYGLLSKYLLEAQIKLRKLRAAQPHINAEDLGECLIALPSVPIQKAIASFLDQETSRIDALLSKKQRQIKLLQEKRQAIITRAVTKGLSPNAKMKDSGVAWLGRMPSHWQLRRLRYVAQELGVGVVVNPSQYVSDEGLPFLYGSDISEGYINTKECRRISEKDSRRLPKSRLREGDLVMVRVGAPGVTAVVPQELDGANCACCPSRSVTRPVT